MSVRLCHRGTHLNSGPSPGPPAGCRPGNGLRFYSKARARARANLTVAARRPGGEATFKLPRALGPGLTRGGARAQSGPGHGGGCSSATRRAKAASVVQVGTTVASGPALGT